MKASCCSSRSAPSTTTNFRADLSNLTTTLMQSSAHMCLQSWWWLRRPVKYPCTPLPIRQSCMLSVSPHTTSKRRPSIPGPAATLQRHPGSLVWPLPRLSNYST
ncbi:hypothetical protein RvY_18826 [Ramazzottius varieornatus]|uniref:Uncharacterized protein n=1 Tax=Ramazzottius varieornatus TaxID=947166 RepID=A0A1D1W7A2_RAMVA|nr:hypothetical protein RvY_18826 [Ramazzottius varieornatus]